MTRIRRPEPGRARARRRASQVAAVAARGYTPGSWTEALLITLEVLPETYSLLAIMAADAQARYDTLVECISCFKQNTCHREPTLLLV
jgi:hypothetical protein